MKSLRRPLFIVVALVLNVVALGGAASAQPVVPVTPLPSPTPTFTPTPAVSALRTFSCNCFSGGLAPVWSGRVAALGYTLARQQATGKCLAALNAKPLSPFIPTPFPGVSAMSRILPTPVAPMFNPCATCACN